MTPDRLATCLAVLRWTPGQVAVWSGYTRVMGYSWAAGRTPTPPQVAAWLEDRMDGHLDEPAQRPTSAASHAATVPPGSAF